jgi:hypothetical protein
VTDAHAILDLVHPIVREAVADPSTYTSTLKLTPEMELHQDAIAYAMGILPDASEEVREHAVKVIAPRMVGAPIESSGDRAHTRNFPDWLKKLREPIAPITFTEPAPEPTREPEPAPGDEVLLCPDCLRVIEPGVRHECLCEEAA